MTWEIRAATIADATPIAIVHVASWRAAYRGLLPDQVLADLSVPERTARWESLLSGGDAGRVFVAHRGEELLGFVSVGASRDSDAGEAVGEVGAVYLRPDATGQGLGRQLMTTGLAALARDGFGEATLWVLETNAVARAFYEQGGWLADGARKKDVRPEGLVLDEVRYRRSLADQVNGLPG